MEVLLKLAGVLLLAAGITGEVAGAIPATGLALVLGTSLAMYCWFLALARQRTSQRRRR